MPKRRPTAADRKIADFVLRLPIGTHLIIVQPDNRSWIRVEGSLHIEHEDKRITLIEDETRIAKMD